MASIRDEEEAYAVTVELMERMVGHDRYCMPRHVIPFHSTHDDTSGCVMTFDSDTSRYVMPVDSRPFQINSAMSSSTVHPLFLDLNGVR
jgi:hypothetical protein